MNHLKSQKMKLDNNGYMLICEFEGFRSKPYLCPAKLATIGYGNTFYRDGRKVTMIDKEITKAEAFDMFKDIADKFAKKVSTCVTSPLNQNQFNSLVSFAYNVGIANFMNSTLLKRVNVNHNDPDIRTQFLRWDKVGTKKLAGLTKRRQIEADNYFTI
jgi:lysozyme